MNPQIPPPDGGGIVAFLRMAPAVAPVRTFFV